MNLITEIESQGKLQSLKNMHDYRFRPQRRVFQALVRPGSTCHDAPDLAGPMISHLNGGRSSLSNASK